MNLRETSLPEVKLLEPRVFGDGRGFFMESWNAKRFAELGIDASFVQDNHSRSTKGVLRGLHYQFEKPQGKLVRVVAGAVYDVAVDVRRSSTTFGKWFGVELSAENKRQLWIPQGFAHGFVSLREGTEFLYKCTEFYDPLTERCIIWNDTTLAIDWPLDGPPAVSAKDALGLPFASAEVFP